MQNNDGNANQATKTPNLQKKISIGSGRAEEAGSARTPLDGSVNDRKQVEKIDTL